MEPTKEEFTITFDGEAVAEHRISAYSLAQSLLAVDAISRRAAARAYPHSRCEIKVDSDFRPGSFNVDLMIEVISDKITPVLTATSLTFGIVLGVIKLGKFLKGKPPIEKVTQEDGDVMIKNVTGDIKVFKADTIKVYESPGITGQLDRLSGPLDQDGLTSIELHGSGQTETINKEDRSYLRQGDGSIISDNETETVLEVLGVLYDGSPKGWKFFDGERTFTATIEDADFLENVKAGKIPFIRGSTIKVRMRTVQRKQKRITVERYVMEVMRIKDIAVETC